MGLSVACPFELCPALPGLGLVELSCCGHWPSWFGSKAFDTFALEKSLSSEGLMGWGGPWIRGWWGLSRFHHVPRASNK